MPSTETPIAKLAAKSRRIDITADLFDDVPVAVIDKPTAAAAKGKTPTKHKQKDAPKPSPVAPSTPKPSSEFDPQEPLLSMPHLSNTISRLQYKLRVPEDNVDDGYNYIGRLFGPLGATIRQIEAESGCVISVHGRQTLSKKRRPRRSKKNKGGKATTEDEDKAAQMTPEAAQAISVAEQALPQDAAQPIPIVESIAKKHVDVVITAQASDYVYAQYKLNVGVSMVTAILTRTPYDQLKRRQLTDLAVANGTYNPSNDNLKGKTAPLTLSEQLGPLHAARMHQQRLLVARANDDMAVDAMQQRKHFMERTGANGGGGDSTANDDASEYEYMRPMPRATASQYQMTSLNNVQFVATMEQQSYLPHPILSTYMHMQPPSPATMWAPMPVVMVPLVNRSQFAAPSALLNPYMQMPLPQAHPVYEQVTQQPKM